MSRALLEHLRERYAFDATPSTHDLGVYHVAFDELLGGVRVEARLDRGVRAGERIAMLGGTGSGKSSVVAGVLGPAARGVAPILVPLMASEAASLADPSHVVDRVLESVLAAGRAAQDLGHDEARRLRHESTVRRSVERTTTAGVEFALGWVRPEIGRQVREVTETSPAMTPSERMALAADLLRRIAGHDLQPVLVFDDTDRWMAGSRRAAVDGFFGPALRTVGELPASLVVAVNRGYPPAATAHLDTRVDIPDLTASSQLVALLDRRVEAHVAGTDLAGARASGVFDARAVAALWSYYRRRGVFLRDVIQVAHRAVAECVDQGGSIVTEWFVQGSLPDG